MKKSDIKILLVDDEADILEIISYNLEHENYKVYTATNGLEAIEMAKLHVPHLILMDLMMPKMDGIEACGFIRELPELANTIIVFLTARSEDYTQIACFDAGADDFIEKPIKPKLLTSKLKSLLRRFTVENATKNNTIVVGGIEINKDQYTVYKNGDLVLLPKKEFELLNLLASKPGKVFKREDILNTIWGNDVVVGDRTIDVHIRKLRKKVGDDIFKTVKGVGYKINIKS